MSSLPPDTEEFSFETRHASPAHLLTRIESFSMLSKHGISKLESAEFEAGDYKWKLIIFPDGDEVGKKVDHISVYLSMVWPTSLLAGWDVTATINFFLYDHILEEFLCFLGKLRRFHAINPEIRFSKFMDKKTFMEPSNGYVLDDKCVFGAEVFVIGNTRVIERVSLFDLKDPYEREWDISVFSKNGNVWSSEEFLVGGYNWNIDIRPIGNSSLPCRLVSIYLVCIDSENFADHTKVKATCLFWIRNKPDNDNYHTRVTHWFTCSDRDLCLRDKPSTDMIVKSEALIAKDVLVRVRLFVEVIQEAINQK